MSDGFAVSRSPFARMLTDPDHSQTTRKSFKLFELVK